jgi:hypothetical protein
MIDWDTIPDCDLRTAEQWEGIMGEIYSATRVDDEDDNLSVCISQDSLHDIQDQMSKSNRHGRCTQIYAEEVC